jgi:photosystem II stability/assembly factor-like uncharacterized protein
MKRMCERSSEIPVEQVVPRPELRVVLLEEAMERGVAAFDDGSDLWLIGERRVIMQAQERVQVPGENMGGWILCVLFEKEAVVANWRANPAIEDIF